MSLICHFSMLVKANLQNANSYMDYFTLYILLTGSFMLNHNHDNLRAQESVRYFSCRICNLCQIITTWIWKNNFKKYIFRHAANHGCYA